MAARDAPTAPRVVANARHSPSDGGAPRLDRGRLDAPPGPAGFPPNL